MTLSKRTSQPGSRIQFYSPELLFLALSGQPYRGSIYVNYESVGESFDLIEFKKYITSLRARKFNSEDIAYEIFSTINNAIDSKDLGVVVDLSARGGIQQRLSFGSDFKVYKKANIFQIS